MLRRRPDADPGNTYEYRISAEFPAEDVQDPNHGFATVGSRVLLPTDFTVDGVRLRLPRTNRGLADPATPTTGLIRLTRRGISLEPERDPFWLTPSLDDWSLVIDFPLPAQPSSSSSRRAMISSTPPARQMTHSTCRSPVPPGPRPRLVFPNPVSQLRLRGKGFLYAVRISTADDGPTRSPRPPGDPAGRTAPPSPPLLACGQQPADPTDGADRPDSGCRRPAPSHPRLHRVLAARRRLRPDSLAARHRSRRSAGRDDLPGRASHRTGRAVETRARQDNWTLGRPGQRDPGPRELTPGCELMTAFPDSASSPDRQRPRPEAVGRLRVRRPDGAAAGRLRCVPGRAIDAVGRPSPSWTETRRFAWRSTSPPPCRSRSTSACWCATHPT